MTIHEQAHATRDHLRAAYVASEARFTALFENAADMTSIVSAEGTILRVSSSVERILGYTPAELIGRAICDFAKPEDKLPLRRFLAEAVREAGATSGPLFHARAARGDWHALEPVAMNLIDDPAIGGLVITCRDASERHQLEARVRQVERLEAVGQLAGGIAHDFNNVLLVIRGYTSIVRSALEGSELAADLDEIAKASDRAADLTRQLLAFARRQVLKPSVLDLCAVVSDLESLLRSSVREDIELDIDVARNAGGVLADSTQLDQVLLNLVVNARDAMPGGGRIVVSVAPAVLGADADVSPPVAPGRYAALTVTDTGSGIDAADLPYIFEPFFTTKGEGVGTGLGLSTVHGIVGQSGGGIEVSAPPGGGTRMTVYLPAADDAERQDDVADTQQGRLPLGTETILLVEDEDAVRELVQRVLEAAGYQVLTAARPTEAQRLAVAGRIDLLLTDVVMPEMSGYDLASRIHLAQPTAQTLFISGYAHSALVETVEPPPGELLRKPFSPDQLVRAVRAVLDGEALVEVE
jgi:two-component system cell cycle sensor histidine kinase/response regulator CckA